MPPAGAARLLQRVRLAAVLQHLVRQVSALQVWHVISYKPSRIGLQTSMALLRYAMGPARPADKASATISILARLLPAACSYLSECALLVPHSLPQSCGIPQMSKSQ